MGTNSPLDNDKMQFYNHIHGIEYGIGKANRNTTIRFGSSDLQGVNSPG